MLARLNRYRQRYGWSKALELYVKGKLPRRVVSLRLPDLPGVVELRPRTSDRRVFDKIFVAEEYRCELGGRPVRAILDAGANVGYSAMFYANAYPDALVVSVEPDLENFRQLERNVRAFPRVRCVQAGLWPRPARLRIENPEGPAWAFRVVECGPAEDGLAAVTIPELLRRFELPGFDIVKLDVEGAELELFADPGCRAWLEGTRLLVIELHDKFRPGCRAAVENALAGFEFEREELGENTFFRLGPREAARQA